MQHLQPQAVAELIRTARGNQPFLLLCDFDGTLCEFTADPAAARLSTARRTLLERIAADARTTVGLVSGRRLEDVRLRSGLASDRIFLAGFHGFEIEGRGERFTHPDIGNARAHAHGIAAALEPFVAPVPGAFIEDKGLSIVLHFREASPEDRTTVTSTFDRVVQREVSVGHVRVMRGACMLEVLPNIDWNKGNAVAWIRDRASGGGPPLFTVYIGDDVTDEDAFRAVDGHGLRIAASDRVTGADYVVDGPTAVEQILEELSR
jgi:trehalose 6-phosphate phosphatase